MRYVCLVYGDERAYADISPSEAEAMAATCVAYCKDLKAQGRMIAGSPLEPVGAAATIRIRGGKRLVTDGPFAETKEQLLGFMVIEAKSFEEAVEIASGHPAAQDGSVEVRPAAVLPEFMAPLIAP